MRSSARAPLCLGLGLWLGLSLGAARPAAADGTTASPAVETTPVPEAPGPPDRQLVGYVTESGGRLPVLQYPPYQNARLRWTAGFVTTISSLALCATGVGVLLMGSRSDGSLTPQGQEQALAAGGVLTGIGAAGIVAGAVVWHLGRRDLVRMERGLAHPDGRSGRVLPTMSLAPTAGGLRLIFSGSF